MRPDGVMGDTEGEDGDGGGLSSQGMQTTNYTYHLRKGKRAQRGGPRSRQRKEKGVIEPQAALRCPGSQPGIPPIISPFA